MYLSRIDIVPTFREDMSQSELMRLLNEFQDRFVQVNNECVELQREVEELKRNRIRIS